MSNIFLKLISVNDIFLTNSLVESLTISHNHLYQILHNLGIFTIVYLTRHLI